MTESNINLYYEELTNDLAWRAYDIIKDSKNAGENIDDYEAISQAISDGLIYYADQAYVIAKYHTSYCMNWGEQINWDELWEMLTQDITDELNILKETQEA